MTPRTAVLTYPSRITLFAWREIYNASVFLIIIILAAVYVFQISETTTRGFALRDIERSVEIVKFENQKLLAEAVEIKRLPSVTERMQMLGLSKPVNTIYLSSSDVLARR